MVKLGIVCFANNSGLGNQTRRLTYMLKPERLLVINSQSFSKNAEQHFDWYDNFQGYRVDGFPNNHEIDVFLYGLTDVIVCENPLNFYLFSRAKELGIHVHCQSNYEFCDNLRDENLPLPFSFIMPSHWMVEDMSQRFGSMVSYLPPPIDPNEFKQARETNFSRKPTKLKLLHVVGTLAASDRNGTLDLLRAMRFVRGDFSLTIKSQRPLPHGYQIHDPRVIYDHTDVSDPQSLYTDFDLFVQPRRYGGLSLGCNEALMSGLPVIMTDISPNNQLLPPEWLVRAFITDKLLTRTLIDVYAVKPYDLGGKIEWLLRQDIESMKLAAFELAHKTFSPSVLLPKYESLFERK